MWWLCEKIIGWFSQNAASKLGNHLDRQLQAQWEVDRALFEQFRSELPVSGSISFVRNHPVGASFRRDDPEQLFRFLDYWNDPEHEFLDSELDQKRSKLFDSISEYVHVLATNTWSIRDTDFQGIPEEWERDDPERLQEVIKQLAVLGKTLVGRYDDLVRTGRRKLKC